MKIGKNVRRMKVQLPVVKALCLMMDRPDQWDIVVVDAADPPGLPRKMTNLLTARPDENWPTGAMAYIDGERKAPKVLISLDTGRNEPVLLAAVLACVPALRGYIPEENAPEECALFWAPELVQWKEPLATSFQKVIEMVPVLTVYYKHIGYRIGSVTVGDVAIEKPLPPRATINEILNDGREALIGKRLITSDTLMTPLLESIVRI